MHSFFRREMRLAGGLVRRVEDGDTRRAAVVAAHLDLLERSLHHHHVTEDRLMWPLLLTRVPDDLAPIVHLMEAQHERLEGVLERIGALRPVWAASADATARDELAGMYDECSVGLAEHLTAEEDQLLPVAARCMTQPEWDAMGEAARREGRRSESLLVFGMMQHDGDPEVVAGMLAGAPVPGAVRPAPAGPAGLPATRPGGPRHRHALRVPDLYGSTTFHGIGRRRGADSMRNVVRGVIGAAAAFGLVLAGATSASAASTSYSTAGRGDAGYVEAGLSVRFNSAYSVDYTNVWVKDVCPNNGMGGYLYRLLVFADGTVQQELLLSDTNGCGNGATQVWSLGNRTSKRIKSVQGKLCEEDRGGPKADICTGWKSMDNPYT